MILTKQNNPRSVFDRHYALKCPHCSVQSNITAVSIPRYEHLVRFRPQRVGIVYRCDSCNEPVFLRFRVEYDRGTQSFRIRGPYEAIESPQESFEFKYLPETVEKDFREALTCYSHRAHNGFAAMCRRTLQSAFTDLGAEGKTKVLAQLKDLKEMAQVDDDTFEILKQVIVVGHDGAHPHLPHLNRERAVVLLELMKDVLYQLYVRKGKLSEAMTLRQEAIQS